jgi:hypothetical protein
MIFQIEILLCSPQIRCLVLILAYFLYSFLFNETYCTLDRQIFRVIMEENSILSDHLLRINRRIESILNNDESIYQTALSVDRDNLGPTMGSTVVEPRSNSTSYLTESSSNSPSSRSSSTSSRSNSSEELVDFQAVANLSDESKSASVPAQPKSSSANLSGESKSTSVLAQPKSSCGSPQKPASVKDYVGTTITATGRYLEGVQGPSGQRVLRVSEAAGQVSLNAARENAGGLVKSLTKEIDKLSPKVPIPLGDAVVDLIVQEEKPSQATPVSPPERSDSGDSPFPFFD